MLTFVIIFSLVTRIVFGANILVISTVESFSHHRWIEVLVEGLLENEHNITLIGHQDANIKSKNYTVYRMRGFDEIFEDVGLQDQQNADINTASRVLWHYMMLSSEIHLKSLALKLILNYPRNKFDLIIFDLICGHEFYPLIEYFGNPPVVGISPLGLTPYILDAMGSHFYFYYPYFLSDYTDDMTFIQRARNTIIYITEYLLKWHYVPCIYKMAQEIYGKNITPFDQIERKIEILLANYDPILDYAQPLPPNIIPVGGMHVKRSTKLPNDLQDILDKASNGVIYFSFGTIVKPSWLSVETKKIFLDVFARLNQTILWKYTADGLKNIPQNVIIRSWYPQIELLGHRNIKLFITHGGILSSHEAMCHGVPVLVIPFFADQNVNAAKMVYRQVGKKLSIRDLTTDILYETITEIINNPVYKQNMHKISRMFRDQKDSPLEKAIFWIESTLRNKDLGHLSIRARDMTLLQRENLDVYGVILLFIVAFLSLFLMLLKYAVNNSVFRKKLKMKQN